MLGAAKGRIRTLLGAHGEPAKGLPEWCGRWSWGTGWLQVLPREMGGPREPPRQTLSRSAQSRENYKVYYGRPWGAGDFSGICFPFSEKSVTLTDLMESHLSVAC